MMWQWFIGSPLYPPHFPSQVLNGLHSERHAASGIDAMLHRLYAPILYRAFDASNASIRLNALNLLMDAFPISVSQQPKSGGEQEGRIRENQIKRQPHELNLESLAGSGRWPGGDGGAVGPPVQLRARVRRVWGC